MKSILAGLCSIAIIGYVVYRSFTTLMILPFVASGGSASGIYFLLLLLLAIGIVVLSFMKRGGVASALTLILCVTSLLYWWVVICRRSNPIWTDFGWFVVPEIFFASAVLTRWYVLGNRGT